MNKFLIVGIPGTGKSTLVKELKQRGVAAFDMDEVPDLCDWVNKKTGEKAVYPGNTSQEWLNEHSYPCDLTVLKSLFEKYEGRDIYVAGMASNNKELMSLFKKTFLLQAPKEVTLHRLNTREGEGVFARDPQEQEHIFSWADSFEKEMLENGAIPINSETSLDSLTEQILSQRN